MKESLQEMKYAIFPNLLNHIFYHFKLKIENVWIFNTEKKVPQKYSSEQTQESLKTLVFKS